MAHKYRELNVKAGVGGNSCSTCLLGKPGKDHTILIPSGVIVSNSNYQVLGKEFL